MAFLNISLIKATPYFNTLNGDYECFIPKGSTGNIWSAPESEVIKQGPTGSVRPVTFRLILLPYGEWADIPIRVIGTSPLLTQWYNAKDPQLSPPTYKILGSLEGDTTILESNDVNLTSAAPDFDVQSFKLSQPVGDLPFRNAGDWTWAIQRTDIPGESKDMLSFNHYYSCLVQVYLSLATNLQGSRSASSSGGYRQMVHWRQQIGT